MSLNRLIIIFTLPSFLAGCAGFSGTQPPAPVYAGQQKIQKPSVSQRDIKTPSEDIEIQPIQEPSEIKAEPLQPSAVSTPLGEPPTDTQGSLPLDMPPSDLPESSEEPSSDSTSLEKPEPALTPPDTTTSEAISPEKTEPELTSFEPIETTGTLPPAVDALVLAADKSSKIGDIDSADALIERAVRIEPRNAALFYKLAVLRLKQSKPKLAEDLAQKSALLAATDNVLKKNCWLLIAHARELQQDFTGAKEARAKADSFK